MQCTKNRMQVVDVYLYHILALGAISASSSGSSRRLWRESGPLNISICSQWSALLPLLCTRWYSRCRLHLLAAKSPVKQVIADEKWRNEWRTLPVTVYANAANANNWSSFLPDHAMLANIFRHPIGCGEYSCTRQSLNTLPVARMLAAVVYFRWGHFVHIRVRAHVQILTTQNLFHVLV